jgi:hypothetical protein
MKRAFLDNELEIDISCGSEYEPLRVCVSEFVPENDRIASQPVISTDQQSQSSIFTRRYPAPVAMKSLDVEHLGESLRRHAESVAAVQRDDSSNQKLNTISKKLLGVIGRYHSSKSQYVNVCFLIQNLFQNKCSLILYSESSSGQSDDALRHALLHGNKGYLYSHICHGCSSGPQETHGADI